MSSSFASLIKDQRQITLSVLGDSLSHGYTVPAGYVHMLMELLAKDYPSNLFHMHNHGGAMIPPKSQDLLSHLEKLMNGSKQVESFLRKWVLQEQKAMLLLPGEDKQYLENVVRLRYPKVRELFIQYHQDGWWEEFADENEAGDVASNSTEIALRLCSPRRSRSRWRP